jgi:hypothetical protein
MRHSLRVKTGAVTIPASEAFGMHVSAVAFTTGNTLRVGVGAIALPASVYPSPLGDTILHIIQVRALKEVARVATGWVVAVVEHVHPDGNRPLRQHIGDAMRLLHPPKGSEPTILTSALPCRPWPTGIGSA